MAMRRSLWKTFCALASSSSSIGKRPLSTVKSTIPKRELKISCSDGTVLAAQQWISPTATDAAVDLEPILCLHGWMDNCETFCELAPALSATGKYNVIALDMVGHGRSSHKSIDAPPMIQADLAYYLYEALESLHEHGHWSSSSSQQPPPVSPSITPPPVTLIGHSLGAGVCSLFAASFPEYVERLVLLDAASFLARKPQDTALHARKHLKRRRLFNHQQQQASKPQRSYSTLEAAIQRRIQSSKVSPGGELSYEVAHAMVLRATHLDNDDNANPQSPTTQEEPVRFQHDPRFAWPSLQYMTAEQVEGILSYLSQSNDQDAASTMDVCLLLAQDGWPIPAEDRSRLLEILKPQHYRMLPGSHYFHANPNTSRAVIDEVLHFLSSRVN